MIAPAGERAEESPLGECSAPPPRVVLVSTYDLGRQPFGLASPAAWLRRAGARVACIDLAVGALDEAEVRSADFVAFHLPMHTATRLAAREVPRVRALNRRARIGFFGLYAAMNEAYLRRLGADLVVGGEFERVLTEWVQGAAPSASTVTLERLAFVTPDRSGLPELARYARVDTGDGGLQLVGYTEASRGCKHTCRHCPIVPVYQGRFRVVPREVVLADIRQQVDAGARHITFGDPDFWNGIGHALPILREVHREFPEVTYDVTIKIEHLLQHSEHLATLRETGCLFVTSAIESVDDRVLQILDKRHTRADFVEVVRRFRAAGLVLHPTFVAFTPWVNAEGYLDMLDEVARLDLIDNLASVQLAIRLLVPAGSRLLELPEVRSLVGPFDEAALCHPWGHPDPRMDLLHRDVEALVRDASARGEGRASIFERVREMAASVAGETAREEWQSREPSLVVPHVAHEPKRAPIPFLTEPWYC